MIKIFLCILLVVLCTAFGWFLTRKHKQRKVFFYNLSLFNDRLINEVSYTKMPLTEFMNKYTFEGDFAKLLSEKKENGFRGTECEFAYLTEDDKNFVRDYFSMVGKSDAASQKAYLTSVRADTERLKKESDENYKKYFNLYVKLGFLFGLMLVVLLV